MTVVWSPKSCIHCYLDTGLFNRYPLKHHKDIKWAEWNGTEYKIDKGDD
jgi:hypothetical protein